MQISVGDAREFLHEHIDPGAESVELAGEGTWSRCFGYSSNGDHRVIRFGRQKADFLCDQKAASFDSQQLPVPKFFGIGEAFGGYYAITSRVFGTALEFCSPDEWNRTVTSAAAAIEAMRVLPTDEASGWGLWSDAHEYPTRRDYLLAVIRDDESRRTRGWTDSLRTSPTGQETFDWGYELMARFADVGVPKSVVHGDLINRNVYVDSGRVTGLFDWGCATYNDHLYEIALLQFWAPWHPSLDFTLLYAELDQQWKSIGYIPEFVRERFLVCHLHIGLDHLQYLAYIQDWETLVLVEQRMRHFAGQAADLVALHRFAPRQKRDRP